MQRPWGQGAGNSAAIKAGSLTLRLVVDAEQIGANRLSKHSEVPRPVHRQDDSYKPCLGSEVLSHSLERQGADEQGVHVGEVAALVRPEA